MAYLGQIGGTGDEHSGASTVDAAGNFYVTGDFEGTADVDPGPGISNLTTGGRNGFVARYSPSGTLDWARQFYVNGPVKGLNDATAVVSGIAVDATGTYLAGTFRKEADFTGDGTYVSSVGDTDIFIVKLDSNTGNTLWAERIGGKQTDVGRDLAISNGRVYVTGAFSGTVDFDPGPGTHNLTTVKEKGSSGFDAFVLTLDASTGDYVHAWSFGGPYSDQAYRILVDGDTLFLAGLFSGTADFDPTSSSVTRSSDGRDRFFASYSTSGELNWVQSFRTAENEVTGLSLAADATQLYLAGEFKDSVLDVDPSDSVYNLASDGARKTFVARYSKDLGLLDSAFTPALFGGNTSSDGVYLNGMVVDAAGAAYVGSWYWGTVDLDAGAGVVTPPSDGAGVVKLDTNGNYLTHWHSNAGWAAPAGVVDDTIYVLGTFSGTATFPTGETLESFGGSSDVYIFALDQASATLQRNQPAALLGSNTNAPFVGGLEQFARPTTGRKTPFLPDSKAGLRTAPIAWLQRIQAARVAALESWSDRDSARHRASMPERIGWAGELPRSASNEVHDILFAALV